MSIEKKLEDLVAGLPSGMTENVALGTGIAAGYDLFDTAIGTVAVSFGPEGVTSLDTVDGFEQRFSARFGRPLIRAHAPSAWAARIPEAIERGTPGSLPVDLSAVTEFQAEVLQATATIPKGEVRPYGWVAKEVSRPKAVRAVGSAVARNPIPLIIPCHRVVRTDGHVGNYSLGGPHRKVELLTHEGAAPDRLEKLAALGVRVQGNSSTGIYCHPTCAAIRRSKEANVVDFHSGRDASDAGFRPCRLCRPTS